MRPRVHPRCPAARVRHTGTALIAAVVLGGCGAPGGGSPTGTGIAVVAAENFWGDIAAQIGGGHVRVTSIISDPSADPHTYETDARAAAAVSGATVVIENGAGYDRFIDRLLDTNPQQGRSVLTIAGAVGVTGDNPNPHLWYNPDYVIAAAHAIENQLAARDPADGSTFAANLQRFVDAYRPYTETLAAIRARYNSAPVGYTERLPGYLLARAGLRVVTPASFAQSIEDGNDPSPGDTAAMESAVTQGRVKLLLYNAQVTSPVTKRVRDLAAASGIAVVGLAETLPSGQPSFQVWQIQQARAILAGLGG